MALVTSFMFALFVGFFVTPHLSVYCAKAVPLFLALLKATFVSFIHALFASCGSAKLVAFTPAFAVSLGDANILSLFEAKVELIFIMIAIFVASLAICNASII